MASYSKAITYQYPLIYYQHRHKIILQSKPQARYHPSQSDERAVDREFTIVCYFAIISDRAHTGKKENTKIDSPGPLQITRFSRAGLYITVNCLANLLCFVITVSFLHLERDYNGVV